MRRPSSPWVETLSPGQPLQCSARALFRADDRPAARGARRGGRAPCPRAATLGHGLGAARRAGPAGRDPAARPARGPARGHRPAGTADRAGAGQAGRGLARRRASRASSIPAPTPTSIPARSRSTGCRFKGPKTPPRLALAAALRVGPAGRHRLPQRAPDRPRRGRLHAVHARGARPAARPDQPPGGAGRQPQGPPAARGLVELGRHRAPRAADPGGPGHAPRPRLDVRRELPRAGAQLPRQPAAGRRRREPAAAAGAAGGGRPAARAGRAPDQAGASGCPRQGIRPPPGRGSRCPCRPRSSGRPSTRSSTRAGSSCASDGRPMGVWRRAVGLRSVEVRRGLLYLNNRRIQLRGASIHEDMPGHGAALTGADNARIVADLQSLGANVTRAHYLLNEDLLQPARPRRDHGLEPGADLAARPRRQPAAHDGPAPAGAADRQADGALGPQPPLGDHPLGRQRAVVHAGQPPRHAPVPDGRGQRGPRPRPDAPDLGRREGPPGLPRAVRLPQVRHARDQPVLRLVLLGRGLQHARALPARDARHLPRPGARDDRVRRRGRGPTSATSRSTSRAAGPTRRST